VATAIRWVAHWRATGEIEGPPRKSRVSRLDAHTDWLVTERLADPDMTLDVLAERLEAERGVPIHPATLSRFFAAQAITVKKNAVRQ
jgi:transposase